MLKLSDNNDSKKLYSFEDQEFRNSEIQESINFGYNKEDNALNAPSPIQNNTMQELDIEFLKEYEDAISDRDKKIAELMYEIERLNKEKNNTISISNNKEIKQKLKTNFEFLAKLIKNIENLLTFHQISDESPKFISEEHKFEKVDILNVLNEALSSLEQDLNQFFELNSQNTTNYKHNDSSTQNFIKIDNNINHERISEFADNLKKENLELKFELQNSIQQIQELEIENIGLSDQISTLSKQSDNLKFLQSKINEKEEILQERNEKLEIEINEREEQHLKEMGGLKEKYNLLLEKKQEEIADLNNSKQSLLQFEVKIQDLLNDLNYKNSLLAPMNLKNKRLAGKIQALKKNFKKIIYDKMANFKYELNFLRKSFIESNLQIFDKLKTSLPALVQKFNLDKKLMEIDFEKVIHKQKNEFQLKINKYKGRIKDLKKEILLAREFKYEPPEETMNLMQSKFISEIDERKSFYPKDFMKETSKLYKIYNNFIFIQIF